MDKMSSISLSSGIDPIVEILIKLSKEALEPTAFEHLQQMNKPNWKILITNCKAQHDEITRILTLFGTRLAPEQYEILLEVQDIIQSVVGQDSAFPDIIAIPDEDLPSGVDTIALNVN